MQPFQLYKVFGEGLLEEIDVEILFILFIFVVCPVKFNASKWDTFPIRLTAIFFWINFLNLFSTASNLEK